MRYLTRVNSMAYIRSAFTFFLYSLALMCTYVYQVQDENAYSGMQPLDYSFYGILVGGGLVFLISLISVKKNTFNPSDILVVLYLNVTIVSFALLYSSSGVVGDMHLVTMLLILTIPLFLVAKLKIMIPPIKVTGVITPNTVDMLLMALLFLVGVASYFNAPSSVGFSIDDSYVRRIEGRESFSAGSLLAYGLAMCMNGVAPFLGFRAIVRRRLLLVLCAIGFTIYTYWLLGIKAPFLYIILACLLAKLYLLTDKLNFLSKFLLWGVIVLFFIVLFEWYIEGRSLVADYFFRRLFHVTAEVIGYYSEVINQDVNWSLWSGLESDTLSITYYIGENYYASSVANVNTNAFLVALGENGVFGYIMCILFVSIILGFFDQQYAISKNSSYIFLGFIYGSLLIEQAYTTAFLSSGVALILMVTLFEKRDLNQ